jgi:hypothetical protein
MLKTIRHAHHDEPFGRRLFSTFDRMAPFIFLEPLGLIN